MSLARMKKDTTRCKEKCRDEGYCCNDPAVGSNQLLSCAQACMIRARGDGADTCGVACDAQADSRGCSRTVSGHTYGMCSKCSDLDASSAQCRWGVPSVDACHAGCAIAPQGAKGLKAKVTGAASNSGFEADIKSYVDLFGPNRVEWQVKIEKGHLALPAAQVVNGVTIEAGTACESYNWHIHAKSTGLEADRCGGGATGGHVDNGLACGGASQYAGTTCKALEYVEAYAVRCSTGKQSGCEYGDLSGKMGKIPVTIGETNEFEDNHLQRLENYDGTSIVLHCCVSAKNDKGEVQSSCKQRVACGDLTLS